MIKYFYCYYLLLNEYTFIVKGGKVPAAHEITGVEVHVHLRYFSWGYALGERRGFKEKVCTSGKMRAERCGSNSSPRYARLALC
jgi:hypothetical protein